MNNPTLAFIAEPSIFPLICAVLGLLVGSFLNVMIHRLPLMMEREWQLQAAEASGIEAPAGEALSLTRPRSRCPQCGHLIRAWENIPLISWLILRGKCSGCKKPISVRYPLIELFSAVLSGFAAIHFGFSAAALGAILLGWALIALSFIDFDTQFLPDSLTLPLVWLGLLFNLQNTYTALPEAVIGAMLGYLSLWLIYWAFKLITGKEGMGYGDFKLLAALGAWLGWTMLPAIILLSSLVGAVIGISLILFAGRGRQIPIPFGPYLAIAGLIALYWGDNLNQFYLNNFYA